jgi:hypothetical protein
MYLQVVLPLHLFGSRRGETLTMAEEGGGEGAGPHCLSLAMDGFVSGQYCMMRGGGRVQLAAHGVSSSPHRSGHCRQLSNLSPGQQVIDLIL